MLVDNCLFDNFTLENNEYHELRKHLHRRGKQCWGYHY